MSRSVVYLPNIHEALASGTQGKYTAQDLLQLQQANYNAAIAPRTGYGGVYDFFAPIPSTLTASNQTEYVAYVSRYSDGVPGNTDPVPLYDVAKQYKTGVGQYTDSRVKQGGGYPFDDSAGSVSGAEGFWSRMDLSELSVVQTAHANPGGAAAVAITGGDVMLNMLTLGVGAKVAMPETLNALARSVGPAALPVAAGMIAHNASTQHADDINRYASIAKNSDSEVEITVADRMAANPYGWFDESYAAEAEAVNHMAKGRALEREGKIGKAVVQRAMPLLETETSALLRGMDTSSDRPAITDFSTHYRPKSILSTPDQSTELAELNRLPGFRHCNKITL